MTMTTQVTGLSELLQNLRTLPGKVQAKALQRAVGAGAEVIRAEAELRAPVHTGKIGKAHPPAGTLKKSVYKARLLDECTATRETWQVNVRKKAYYAHMVEFGTVKMAPRPFMRPAWDSKKDDALDAIRTKLSEAVRSALKVA